MKQLILMVLLLAGTIPAALANPFVGLAVYFSFATLYPQHLWERTLPETVRWSLLIGAPTVASFVLHGFARTRAGSRWPLEKKAFFGLAVLTLLSMVDAVDPDLARVQLYYFLVIFTMFFISCALLDSRFRLHTMATLLVGTLGWVAFDFNQRYIIMEQKNVLVGGFGSLDNNGAATLMVMAMPFCVFLFTQQKRWVLKLAGLGAMVLMLHMVLFSMSRAAMLASVVMLPLLLLRIHKRKVGVVLFIIMIIAAMVLAGGEVRDRFFSITKYQTDESAQIRLRAWSTGVEVLKDNPILGIGPDCFRRVVGDYAFDIRGRTMHNRFIQTAVDMGIPAGLCLIAGLVITLVHMEKVRRMSKDDPFAYDLATCLEACLIGYILVGMFVSIGTVELPYIAMAMAIGLYNVKMEENLTVLTDPSLNQRRRARAVLENVRPALT